MKKSCDVPTISLWFSLGEFLAFFTYIWVCMWLFLVLLLPVVFVHYTWYQKMISRTVVCSWVWQYQWKHPSFICCHQFCWCRFCQGFMVIFYHHLMQVLSPVFLLPLLLFFSCSTSTLPPPLTFSIAAAAGVSNAAEFQHCRHRWGLALLSLLRFTVASAGATLRRYKVLSISA